MFIVIKTEKLQEQVLRLLYRNAVVPTRELLPYQRKMSIKENNLAIEALKITKFPYQSTLRAIT